MENWEIILVNEKVSKVGDTMEGDLEIIDTTKGIILKSPLGTRYRIKVADNGTLSTEVVV